MKRIETAFDKHMKLILKDNLIQKEKLILKYGIEKIRRKVHYLEDRDLSK